MSNQVLELLKSLADGLSRRRLAGTVLAAIGITVLAVSGIRESSAAPPPCAVFCAGLPGPAKASCLQACRRCQADSSRLCFTPTAFVCCPSGETCCFDCSTGRQRCGTASTCSPGTCEDTCGPCS